MKKLSIIRHAKSDWSHNLPDMDRPISQRGSNDADVMSNVIQDLNLEPQIIFSSPATCLLYTSPSPRDRTRSRMPSSA